MYIREAQGKEIRFRYRGLSDEPQEFFEELSKDIMREMNNSSPIGVQTVINRVDGIYSYNQLRLDSDDRVVFNFYDSGLNSQDRSKSRLEDLANHRGFEIELAEA